MAKLTTAQRDKLKDSDFAYVEASGERHLPIHDEEHVRNAIARWNQTDFASVSDKDKARQKILRAAKKHGVDVAEDDKLRK